MKLFISFTKIENMGKYMLLTINEVFVWYNVAFLKSISLHLSLLKITAKRSLGHKIVIENLEPNML